MLVDQCYIATPRYTLQHHATLTGHINMVGNELRKELGRLLPTVLERLELRQMIEREIVKGNEGEQLRVGLVPDNCNRYWTWKKSSC